MQHLEVSGAVRHIYIIYIYVCVYIYIYICVIRRLKVKLVGTECVTISFTRRIQLHGVPPVSASLHFRCGNPSKAPFLPRDYRPCRKVSYRIGWLVCTVALSPFRNSRTRSLALYLRHVSLQGDTRQAFRCGFVTLRPSPLFVVK